MFSTLRAGYNSLQASTQPQSATSTIDKLCDRLLNSQQREDRRAALLAIKGLSRDWKSVSLLVRPEETSKVASRWGGALGHDPCRLMWLATALGALPERHRGLN